MAWTQIKAGFKHARKLGLAKLALDGTILDTNDAYASILDRDPLELINVNVAATVPLGDIPLVKERLNRIAQKKANQLTTKSHRVLPSGVVILCQVERIGIFDGNPQYIVEAMWEISATLPPENREILESVEHLEAMFELLKSQQTTVNVMRDNNSNNSGTISINQSTLIIVACIALVIITFVMAFFGGAFKVNHTGGGTGTITIEN